MTHSLWRSEHNTSFDILLIILLQVYHEMAVDFVLIFILSVKLTFRPHQSDCIVYLHDPLTNRSKFNITYMSCLLYLYNYDIDDVVIMSN